MFKDGANVGWQRKLAQAEIENARRLQLLGRPADAKESAVAAQRAVDRAMAGAPDDVTTQLVSVQTQLVLGDIAQANADEPAARTHWTRAKEAVGARAPASKDPVTLDAWIGALLRLGETTQAIASLRVLSSSGYRDPDFISLLTAYGIASPPMSETANRIAQLANKKSASDGSRD